jgi:hypothetical protein
MSELANRSRNRNWQKARLMGFHIDITNLTEDEQMYIESIRFSIKQLLNNWDVSTYLLVNKPMPEFKCVFCGRRSNKSHFIEAQNYCLKHYKLINHE